MVAQGDHAPPHTIKGRNCRIRHLDLNPMELLKRGMVPMLVRLKPSTYLRCVEDESLLFCPRNEAASIVENAQVVLTQLSSDFQRMDHLFRRVASMTAVPYSRIVHDFAPLLKELACAGLMEYVDGDIAPTDLLQVIETVADVKESDSVSFVIDFFKRHNIPAEIHIDLTSACNERCVHCYYPDHPNTYLPYSDVEKVLREFRNVQGLTVYLSGGECMLHPQFEEICKLCRNLDLNVIILTNLTVCSEERIALLQRIAPQFINVSLYSMDAEVHDCITRVHGSWNKTMGNFLACEKAGLHMRIATPLLKENKDSFGELARFAAEHGSHIIPDYTIFAQADHGTGNMCHMCSGIELESVLRKNKKLFASTLWGGHEASERDRVCRIGDVRLYVNARGDYYPCEGMHQYVLGNIRSHTLEKVWQCEGMQELRRLTIAYFAKCRGCSLRKYCMVCPAFNFNSTGDLLTPGTSKCEAAAVVERIYKGDL